MGGLLGSLESSIGAFLTYENAIAVTQNNVSNASTPGYSSQTATFESMPFAPGQGLQGGVQAGPTLSTDNFYADQAVRAQLSYQGNYAAQSTALSSIQGLFDVNGQTGVLGALNSLFQSFSAWSASPDTPSAEQAVLNSAQALAQSFQSTANTLSQITTGANQQIGSTVQQINSLAAQIAADNQQIRSGSQRDPGLEANLNNALNSLSQLTDTTVTFNSDGTATVLLGSGQAPLVIGTQQYTLQANFSGSGSSGNAGAVPDVQILDSNGQDVTGQISQGTLGGLLAVRNGTLASLQGNATQQGSLNQLAQQVADDVNSILTSAQTSTGAKGVALFTYNNASPVGIAQTLALNPNITPDALAAASPGPPPVANGAALELANLGNSTDPAFEINGQTILQFASGIATQVGQQTSDAESNQTLHTTLLSQAQAVQTQISGVSLDAQAAQITILQKGYDAIGKVVSVIDDLTSTLLNMVPSS